jgi:predicted transposase YdaD
VNLLAVTQVMARLRFPAPHLLEILGGKKIMIESPLLKELMSESRQEGRQQGLQEGRQEALIRFLRARFRTVSESLATRLRAIHDETQLDALIEQAAVCPSLAKFREGLPAQ